MPSTPQPILPPVADGQLRRTLGAFDLTLIGFGSIFGSGWLFAASRVAGLAGPAGIVSWLVGGVAVLLLGFIYCELGAALPQAGGVIRFPALSHGRLVGCLAGFITLIAFSSLIAIEIVAARQYASAWWPALTVPGGTSPSLLGWLVQLAVLAGCFGLNWRGMRSFAALNNIVTLFKFAVPALCVAVLAGFFRRANLASHGFAPFGFVGMEAAVSTGGVIFAYLGLTPIVSVAAEVRNPQRAIPIALITSMALSTLVYVALQTAFIGAVPPASLAHGWREVGAVFALPYRDLAALLGVGWLGLLIVADAVISPSGTGNIYMNATPRVVLGWADSGTFPRLFRRVDAASGVPRPALWLTFALSVFWTLPFPSWDRLIGIVSSALMLSYALAPVSAAALRRDQPGLPRPFRVRGMAVLGPASFIVASLIVYWAGWSTMRWLLGLQLLFAAGYMVWAARTPQPVPPALQLRGAAWLLAYCALMMGIGATGSFGGRGIVPHPYDLAVVAIIALATYLWGERTGPGACA